jgi:hypothetical protein
MKAHHFLVFSFALVLLPLARAEVDLSISAEIRLGKIIAPPPPEVIVVDDSGPKAPPPWAPAHGFRRNRDYYFYPGTNVYYRPDNRTWIYLEGREWRVGATLPTAISVDFDRCVSLTMETDKPYEFHEKVVAYYPANYFTKKVKLKSEHALGKPDKAGKAQPGRASEDDRGKGKGKGKGKNKDR